MVAVRRQVDNPIVRAFCQGPVSGQVGFSSRKPLVLGLGDRLLTTNSLPKPDFLDDPSEVFIKEISPNIEFSTDRFAVKGNDWSCVGNGLIGFAVNVEPGTRCSDS
jgi:hypothetical protein